MELIRFELNNWFEGRDYPDEEPFITWMCDDLNQYFMKENWIKENELVVTVALVDMSFNYCIVAKKSWIEENCPKLLTTHSKFVRDSSRFDIPFREYCPENFGVRWYDFDLGGWEDELWDEETGERKK